MLAGMDQPGTAPDAQPRPSVHLRPMPDGFAEDFLEPGHDRILEEIHRAGWRTIVRWIHELPDDVKEAREAHLFVRWPNGRPGPNRRRNYVLGNRLRSC